MSSKDECLFQVGENIEDVTVQIFTAAGWAESSRSLSESWFPVFP